MRPSRKARGVLAQSGPNHLLLASDLEAGDDDFAIDADGP